jgi:hypothetical protein
MDTAFGMVPETGAAVAVCVDQGSSVAIGVPAEFSAPGPNAVRERRIRRLRGGVSPCDPRHPAHSRNCLCSPGLQKTRK